MRAETSQLKFMLPDKKSKKVWVTKSQDEACLRSNQIVKIPMEHKFFEPKTLQSLENLKENNVFEVDIVNVDENPW